MPGLRIRSGTTFMITAEPRVFGYTLGCRLNAYETESMVDDIVSSTGGTRADRAEDADVILVNTCAVTGRSQARSRKAVRSYASRYPEATIVVTGCVAEVSPDDFSEITSEKIIIVPVPEKEKIVSILTGRKPEKGKEGIYPWHAPAETSRTRAFLKIQDGCSNRCSYCIVPLARGDSRSQHREIVLKQAHELAARGYREICLTGVDIADYGTDIYNGKYDLTDLVRDLMDLGGFRLRIGSIEPLCLSVKTLEKLAEAGVCRHFHIPFQSGSEAVLKRMGRPYGEQEEYELLDAVEELFSGACLGSDMIAGFPEETFEDFMKTRTLAEDSRINYLHVFPYSPRPGTPAAEMQQLHTETITGRAEELRRISTSSRNSFRESMIGTTQTILVENREYMGSMLGLTDNYIPVKAPEGAGEGELVQVELTRENICWGLR